MSIDKQIAERHARLKVALGMESASCGTCTHLGSEGDGPEYNGSWLICEDMDRMANLKSFPFKKDMKCWEPEFWHSKFADMIKTGTNGEVHAAINAFVAARGPILAVGGSDNG